jgi:hypothetical protein
MGRDLPKFAPEGTAEVVGIILMRDLELELSATPFWIQAARRFLAAGYSRRLELLT